MARLFVPTLGFTEGFAIRRLTSQAASRSDGLLVLTVKPLSSGTRNAYDSLEAFARRMGLKYVDLAEVPIDSFPEAVKEIIFRVRDSMDRNGFTHLVGDLSGGMRILVVSSFMAFLMLSAEYPVEVWVQGESGEAELRLEHGHIRLLRSPLSREKFSIIRAVALNPGCTPDYVSRSTGIKVKTVKNHLTHLKKQGLIAQRGRAGGLYVTSWGSLLVSLASLTAERGRTA